MGAYLAPPKHRGLVFHAKPSTVDEFEISQGEVIMLNAVHGTCSMPVDRGISDRWYLVPL